VGRRPSLRRRSQKCSSSCATVRSWAALRKLSSWKTFRVSGCGSNDCDNSSTGDR
jgi:hypothetical protein